MFTRQPGGWQLSLCGNDRVTQADNLVLAGAVNCTLLALNMRDGLRLSGRLSRMK